MDLQMSKLLSLVVDVDIYRFNSFIAEVRMLSSSAEPTLLSIYMMHKVLKVRHKVIEYMCWEIKKEKVSCISTQCLHIG